MVLIAQYAGVGETCPEFGVAITSGGTLASGTLYFSFQLQNRAGFNIPSVSGEITYSTNQKIVITIPEMPLGWDIHYFVISAGATNDPSTHVQIARIPGFQYGEGVEPQSVKTVLPATLELTRDSHLSLAPSIANAASLPVGSDRLDGQVRYITNLSIFAEYRADSGLPLSVDVITADIGQWVRIGGASTYVSNTRQGMGSDRPIDSINPVTTIPTPPYPGETLSKHLPAWEAKYWIYNDNTNALPAGTEFGIDLEYNFKRSPDLLSGLVLVKFIGFVGIDGSIRTQDSNGRNFQNFGAFFPWTPKLTTPFITTDDLQPGEAIAFAIKPFFSVVEFNNEVTPKSIFGVFPVTRAQSGDYNPLGKLFTRDGEPIGIVFDIGDRYRVVPGTGLSYDVLSGSALIGGYDFPEKPRRSFGGLQPNTAGQKIIANGNASIFTELSAYTPSASEGIRAIVSTVAGESSPGGWSSYTAITAGATITLSYPSTADGVGTIRADYPDVIAEKIYATTTASYTQPAAGASVTVPVTSSALLFVGQTIFVSGGGTYSVASVPTIASVSLTNLGYSGNATAGAVIPTSQMLVSIPKGLFNPFSINIYLQRQDTLEIRRFSGFGVVASTSQQFTISNWTAGVIDSLPTADADFSLFAPLSGAIVPNITGNFPPTNYRVAYSFVYDGNQITSISHAWPPCIKEFEGDFQPANLAVNPVITILNEGDPPTVINTGTGNQAYLTFSFPPFLGSGGSGSGFDSDAILTDSDGRILVDSNGNVLTN